MNVYQCMSRIRLKSRIYRKLAGRSSRRERSFVTRKGSESHFSPMIHIFLFVQQITNFPEITFAARKLKSRISRQQTLSSRHENQIGNLEGFRSAKTLTFVDSLHFAPFLTFFNSFNFKNLKS